MVTIVLVLCLVYFGWDYNDHWNDTTNYGQSKRFFSTLYILFVLLAIFALNNAFTFPTDLQEIRRMNHKE